MSLGTRLKVFSLPSHNVLLQTPLVSFERSCNGLDTLKSRREMFLRTNHI